MSHLEELPEKPFEELAAGMTPEVLEAMNLLVTRALASIKEK